MSATSPNFLGVKNAVCVYSEGVQTLLLAARPPAQPRGGPFFDLAERLSPGGAEFSTMELLIIYNSLRPVLVHTNLAADSALAAQPRAPVPQKFKGIAKPLAPRRQSDLDTIREACERDELRLVEISCASLDSTYGGQKTGNVTGAAIATVSQYPAHRFPLGEGGGAFMGSPPAHLQVRCFRYWGRDCDCETGKYKTCGKRFEWQLGEPPKGHGHKYTFSHIGYNLRATGLQPAIGISQIDKLKWFVSSRNRHSQFLAEGLPQVAGLILQRATVPPGPAWFGFSITLEVGVGFSRKDLVEYVDSMKIGIQFPFTGSLLRQLACKKVGFRLVNEPINTVIVTGRTFWVVADPGSTHAILQFVVDTALNFASAWR